MADYDLIVRGGTVMTESDTMRADIGIRDGRIAALPDGFDASAFAGVPRDLVMIS